MNRFVPGPVGRREGDPPDHAVAPVGDERSVPPLGVPLLGPPGGLPGQPARMHAVGRPVGLGLPGRSAGRRALSGLGRPGHEPVARRRPGRGDRVEGGRRVPRQPDVGSPRPAEVLGPDVHLDDALVGREQRQAAVDEVRVEPGPRHHGDVGRGERDPAVHQPAEAARVVVVEEPAGRAGRDHRDAGPFGEGGERRARAPEEGTRTGHDDGPLRRGQQVHRPVEVAGHRDRPSLCREPGRPRSFGRRRGRGRTRPGGSRGTRPPERPTAAWCTAAATYSGMRSVCRHSARHLVTGPTRAS